MKGKLLVSILVLSAIFATTPFFGSARETSPTSVLFGLSVLTTQGLFNEYRQDGPNWIQHDGIQGQLIGDISGTMTSDAIWKYNHWVGPVQDPMMLEVTHGNGHVVIIVDPATFDDKTVL